MKKAKRILAIMLTLVLSISLLPATGVSAASKKVKLNKTKATVYVGATINLKLKNNKKKVKWSTSNKKVATVTKKGKVKAKKVGKAVITAKVGNKKYKCKISVKKKVVTKPTEQPTTKPAEQTTIKPAEQPTTKPVEQPTTEPIEEPTTDPEDPDEPDEPETKQYGDWKVVEYDDGTVGIAGYEGTDMDVVIPDKINEMPVTIICDSAFIGNCDITSIVMSDNIEEIEDNAFLHCEGLAKVTFSKNLTTIGSGVFDFNCKIKEFVIPESVTEIDDYAFGGLCIREDRFINNSDLDMEDAEDWGVIIYDKEENGLCIQNNKKVVGVVDKNIETAVIPDGITSIGEAAFAWCRKLTEVTISDTVNSIGGGAFSQCDSLKGIKIPEGVKYILDDTFMFCTNMKDVSLPESLEEINEWAFYGCFSLETLRIPEAVNYIGEMAFFACNSIDKPYDERWKDGLLKLTGKEGSYAQEWAESSGYSFTVE